MLRYRIDDLGWFHFEQLVQSLLKADIGIAIESWAGHDDRGRDAYTSGKLSFPDRSTLTEGPFVFQSKFVQGANAAGAAWQGALLKAVDTEIKRILRRIDNGTWEEPTNYVLVTNCPLTTTVRDSIAEALGKAISSDITCLGGVDVCDLLDKHPELRRAFPEILSLRDLDQLLSEVVNASILKRSRAAIKETRDLVPVFVPTSAYHKAWQSLLKHSFVVLDGPPEMGKTAIARTIAFGHLMLGWQVVECRNPNDLFSAFSDECSQIFIADDAFGRTEYDPLLVRMWERDLPRIFQFIGPRHRLIWTTRKHILMRALREMDLTGRSSRFPAPGEVIVTADDLSIEEKARILYRHSRAAQLTVEQKQIVKDTAESVVGNSHFTPERIRRLVLDVLPELASAEGIDSQTIRNEIREAIRNPTNRMRKSFRKLPQTHRWVLAAYLECGYWATVDDVWKRFSAFQPTVSEQIFRESVDELLGTFLKLLRSDSEWGASLIAWIHPSYRDLVIEELASNPSQQLLFLKKVSTSGVQLAISLSGGGSGQRQMPFVTTAESWAVLVRRCRELAKTEDAAGVANLMDILFNALRAEEIPESARAHLEISLLDTCGSAARKWNESGEALSIDALKSYLQARTALSTPPPLPNIESTWEAYSLEIRNALSGGYIDTPASVVYWTELCELIEQHYPDFAQRDQFREEKKAIEHDLGNHADELVGSGPMLDEPEANEAEGRRLDELAKAISRFHDPERVLRLSELAARYQREGVPNEEDDYEEERQPEKTFDIAALFEDL